MTKLSDKAWKHCEDIIKAIHNHPFNKELSKGTLNIEKFAYYIEQDILYLQDFARAYAIIAAKSPLEYVKIYLNHSMAAFTAEEEIIHDFFKKTYKLTDTGKLSPATLAYTSYLIKTCSSEPLEVAVAAMLPCPWVYCEVGKAIAKKADKNNPFSKWIDTYASEEFENIVNEAISIFDALANKATKEIQNKMLDAFYTSTVLEWHFWNDAYNETEFDKISNF